MELLAKEKFDGTIHFWYQADLMMAHEYGEMFNHQEESTTEIAKTLIADINNEGNEQPMYWYFGKTLEEITLMVRYSQQSYIIQINVKDFDFAMNIGEIERWKLALLSQLQKG